MKAPRYAHWLIVPALAIGMIVGPAHAAAPTRGTPAPAKKKAAKDDAANEEAEPTEAPADEDAAPSEGAPSKEAPRKAAPSKEAPSEEAPTEAAPTESAPTEAAPPTDASPTTAPTDAPPAAPADTTPAEPAAPPEPTITVSPRPVSPTATTTTSPPVRIPPREVTLDPRRRSADERILFRAGMLAFGVAGAALVPTVVGFQQAAHADRVLDRLDTPSEAGERPDVESYQRTMTTMALVGGSITVASAITGALLVGLGARRGKPTPPAAVAPSVGPGTAGVVLRGRF